MRRPKAAPALAACFLALLGSRAAATISRPKLALTLAEPAPLTRIADAGLTLRVVALETLWIAVQADGKPTFQGSLSARETATAKAHRVLDVTLGNAHGASLALNGEPMEPVGGPGEVKTLHVTLGDSNTPSVELRSPSQPSLGVHDVGSGVESIQPALCEVLSKKVHQARADNGASLEAAWRAAVAERARKHASVWEDACVVSTLAGIQGLRAEVLDARRIPVQPDQAYIDAANQIRAIDAEIAETPPAGRDTIASLRQIQVTLKSLQSELLRNLVKVEVGKPLEITAGEGWEPAATITNRSSILPLSRIRVPLEIYDHNRKLIWQGSFSLDRLDAADSVGVAATGALIPTDADATFFKVGDASLSVERAAAE